jgi:hypothetical protein
LSDLVAATEYVNIFRGYATLLPHASYLPEINSVRHRAKNT